MPPTVSAIVWLFCTLTVPDCTTVVAPLGPVIVQLASASNSPPANVSFMPTVPTSSPDVPDVPDVDSPSRWPEQPTCGNATQAARPAPTTSPALRRYENE